MTSSVLVGKSNFFAIFQAARSEECEEIVDRSTGFLAELQKEYDKQHFSYSELEENEVDYTKLTNWFAKVNDRDEFGSPGREEAESSLKQCETALEEYAARVYTDEPEGN